MVNIGIWIFHTFGAYGNPATVEGMFVGRKWKIKFLKVPFSKETEDCCKFFFAVIVKDWRREFRARLGGS